MKYNEERVEVTDAPKGVLECVEMLDRWQARASGRPWRTESLVRASAFLLAGHVVMFTMEGLCGCGAGFAALRKPTAEKE